MPMQYTEIFKVVKNDISVEIFCYFSYFCSKHRLWVHVRTASPIYALEQIKIRKVDIPLHLSVLLFKSGVQGGILVTDMFS